MVKMIELGGETQIVAIVDDEDYEHLSKFNWFYGAGYVRRNRLKGEKHERVTINMEQEILNGEEIIKKNTGEAIDHINNLTFDNRKKNIRKVTNPENASNAGIQINNSSGYIGVSFETTTQKWRPVVGKNKAMGLYDDVKEAAKVRDAEAIKQYGENARLNFPKSKNLEEMILEELIVKIHQTKNSIGVLEEIESRQNIDKEDFEISKLLISNLFNLKKIDKYKLSDDFKINILENTRNYIEPKTCNSEDCVERKTQLIHLSGDHGEGFAFLIDIEDYERINDFSWHFAGSSIQRSTKINEYHERNTIQLPWEVLFGENDVWEKDDNVAVDEIDQNNFDVRKINLRVMTSAFKSGMGKKKSNNTSGYIGISWFKQTNKWRAFVTHKSKFISLGYHINKIDAAKAYDKKAKELYGDDAILNFPAKIENIRLTYNLEDLISELIICKEDQTQMILDEIENRESFHKLEIENSLELLDYYINKRKNVISNFKDRNNYREIRKIHKYLQSIEKE